MLWGLPPESWLELWSGAIGALVSAVAAALVAWGVVKATNKHQARLAYVAAMQASKEAQRSRVIDALSEFLMIVDTAHVEIDDLTEDKFKPSMTRLWTLLHTLGLTGGIGMNIRNLIFMWAPMIRELVHQCIAEGEGELYQQTKDALRNAHSAFAVTMPSFVAEEVDNYEWLKKILDDAYEQGAEVLLDKSNL